jgi:hypothetical protein
MYLSIRNVEGMIQIEGDRGAVWKTRTPFFKSALPCVLTKSFLHEAGFVGLGTPVTAKTFLNRKESFVR